MYVQGGYSCTGTITSLLLSSAVPQCAGPGIEAEVFPNHIIPFRPKGKWKIWAVFLRKVFTVDFLSILSLYRVLRLVHNQDIKYTTVVG